MNHSRSIHPCCIQDCGRASAGAGTTVSTYVAGKEDGETQMIKLPGQSGGQHLKDTQVYDVGPCSDVSDVLLSSVLASPCMVNVHCANARDLHS